MDEDEDLTDAMISAWNEPFSTDHDPRLLLMAGAREIRRLRRMLISSKMVITTLQSVNETLAAELIRMKRSPLVPALLFSIVSLAALCLWLLLR